MKASVVAQGNTQHPWQVVVLWLDKSLGLLTPPASRTGFNSTHRLDNKHIHITKPCHPTVFSQYHHSRILLWIVTLQ